MRKLFVPLLFMIGLAQASPTVLKMTIDGTIHNGTTNMLTQALSKAKETNAEALLIELDTPGGMLDATHDIVKLFLNSDLPIIVYVSPKGSRAGSAGTFITMAAHIAAMAPSTNIGAAHPVSATGGDPEKEGGKHMAQKIENDTVAFIESIAKQRGRNAEWAKKAVLESVSTTEDKALELHVIDLIATSENDLLAKADGRTVQVNQKSHKLALKGAQVVMFSPDAYTQFKNWLADPTMMFLLIVIAGLGLYLEFSHPGVSLPGIAAGVSILLLIIANSLIPLTSIGVGLILLGFVLLYIELYITSFGLLAVGGIASLVVGALLLFDPSQSDLRVPRGLIFGTTLGIVAISVIMGVAVSRAFATKQIAGAEGLIGKEAVADEMLLPGKGGRMILNGEYWSAFSDVEIEKGSKVRIVRLDGLKAIVEKVGGQS